MANPVYSVKDINQYVARILQYDPLVQSLGVRGEIANMRRQSSGHTYFTLKDDEASLQCVYFRNAMHGFSDGDRVVVQGALGLYQREGKFQLTVQLVKPDGIGSWFERFQQLKDHYQTLGYFDASAKKALPTEPQTIGVVTSPSGAVIHDIITVAQRRWPGIQILLYPAAVQGVDAAEQIAHAIGWMDQHHACDVLIVGRGGGSAEDLWPFNEPEVVEAIHGATVPVISAVGHETDFTLADFVADVRAATPSAAAELATPDVRNRLLALERFQRRLVHGMEETLHRQSAMLEKQTSRLKNQSPHQKLALQQQRIVDLRRRLLQASFNRMERQRALLKQREAILKAVNPSLVLSRGYAMVEQRGKVLTKTQQFKTGDCFRIHMQDGTVDAEVLKVIHEESL